MLAGNDNSVQVGQRERAVSIPGNRPRPFHRVAGQGGVEMGKVLATRGAVFPFERRAQRIGLHRHQHQVIGARIIKPQRFRQLRGGSQGSDDVRT